MHSESFAVFLEHFFDFTQDLILVLCSSIITVAAHKKLMYKTCHNSTMANHRLAKLDHVSVKG